MPVGPESSDFPSLSWTTWATDGGLVCSTKYIVALVLRNVLISTNLPPPWFQGARLESLLNRISSQRSDYATQVRLCAGDPAAFNPICS